MKVKIGDKIYDSNETPIMIILDDKIKDCIGRMDKDKYKFISYPTGIPMEQLRLFIDTYKDNSPTSMP